MRYFFLFCLLVIVQPLFSQEYDFENVGLYGHWDNPDIVPEPQLGIRYNGCFGWENPQSGRRYAIIGSSRATHVIEVTNPNQLEFKWEIPGSRINCIWREIKTYKNYVYIVSDDGYPNKFQIGDLSYLPDSVHLVHNSDSIFARTHTIFIDGNKLYCASVHSAGQNANYSAMNVYSLANPEKPLLLRRLDEDFPNISQAHDMWVRNDTIFASSAYQGLSILKYDSIQNRFNLITTLSVYDHAGYNHSSTWSKDGKTVVMMDEVPNSLPAKVVNVEDITQPYVTAYFNSSDSTTPHNPYFIGDSKICVCSNYEDGTQIYDMSNPSNPVRLGYFDTHWQTTLATNTGDYRGNWGAYVDFEDGLVVASDMQNGLFLLDIRPCLSGISSKQTVLKKAWPNPTSNYLQLPLEITNPFSEWKLSNYLGQKVLSGWINADGRLDVSAVLPGIYTLELSGNFSNLKFRVVKN